MGLKGFPQSFQKATSELPQRATNQTFTVFATKGSRPESRKNSMQPADLEQSGRVLEEAGVVDISDEFCVLSLFGLALVVGTKSLFAFEKR